MRSVTFFLFTVLGLFSSAASADTTKTNTLNTYQSLAPSTNLNLATTLGSLLLVIAIIVLLAWLLKRMQVPAFKQQGLSVVRQLSVGTKERVAVIQAGDEQFLVGITPQSIQLIAKLAEPIVVETPAVKSAFAEQFLKARQGQSASLNRSNEHE